MFRLIAINFSQKSPHFSLLSPTSLCELSEREVTSPSNLKVVGALHFQKYFSYIMATSFSGGRSQSTRREPPTMGK
jgi:hypothetical protein